MQADIELLQQYAHQGSEEAFAALVTRHVNLVYSAALRKTGNPHAAEEITQAVFIILAKKADRLRKGTILSGWLYQTVRLTAASFLRTEIRRARREQEAYMQSSSNETEPDAWLQIAPLLEDAMGGLSDKDRAAVVLRFFEKKSFQEVGAAFGASENAAKKRVSRALEKLRRFFAKSGILVPAAVLTAAISANTVPAAPVTLAKSVTAMAVAKGAATSSSTLALIKGALKVMAWTKAKTAVVIGIGVLLAATATTVAVKEIRMHVMYPWRAKGITGADIAKFDQLPPQVWIAPAKNKRLGNQLWKDASGKLIGRNTPFSWLLRNAYGKTQAWMVLPAAPTDDQGYDYAATLGSGSTEALQQQINKTFGIVVKQEVRETNVLILKIGKAGAYGIKSPTANPSTELRASRDTLAWLAQPLSTLNTFLEGFFKTPILDQTGLTQKYDFTIKWDDQWWFNNRDNPEGLKRVLLDQLGFELIASNEPIEMLVVEKVK